MATIWLWNLIMRRRKIGCQTIRDTAVSHNIYIIIFANMNILSDSINLLNRKEMAKRIVKESAWYWSWTSFKGTLQEGGQLAVTGSFHNLRQSVVHSYIFYINKVLIFFFKFVEFTHIWVGQKKLHHTKFKSQSIQKSWF